MKRLFTATVFVCACLFVQNASGQASHIDSLYNKVNAGSEEEQLSALSQLSVEYLNSDLPKAKETLNKQLALAGNYSKIAWQADAYGNLGNYYNQQGVIDSAEMSFGKAIELFDKSGDQEKTAIMRMNLSSAQRLAYKFEKAIANLQVALEYFRKQKNEDKESQVLANIGSVYNEMGNNTKHDEYTLKALAIQERIGSKRPKGISLINLCLSMSAQARWNEAVDYGERAIKVFREIDNQFLIGASLVRTASAMASTKNDEKVIPYSNEAMEIAEKIGNKRLKEEVFRLQSDYLLAKKKYAEAKNIAFKALAMADTSNKSNLRFLYDLVATTSIYTGDKENAIAYYKKYVDVNNQSKNKEWSDKISEMEVKYETAKKELQIASLQKNEQRYLFLTILGAFIFVSSLTIFILNRKKILQKKQLAEQRVAHLEQEKQLVATQSLLEGEETERSRLAGDLHDGLGGLLTGVKLKLSDMKENVVMTGDNVENFTNAISLLDRSISEMRRVAHNLMPETLIHYGLRTALSDFIRQVAPDDMIKIGLNTFGSELRYAKELELTIYRTAQELVNNALKHAKATRIDVQLFTEPGRICVQVTDNGIGFQPEMLEQATTGKGLKNIRDRVTAFNGHFEILSQPGKGTESIVEFFVN